MAQRPPRWRWPAAVGLLLLDAVSAAGTANATEDLVLPMLDWSEWSEWDEPPPPVTLTVGAPSAVTEASQELRRVVYDCSRTLRIPSLECGDSFVADDDYRVPFMESPLRSCGFEARTTKDAIEHLAATYTFRFIGDSTTRRLTESFMSISTGQGSTHPKVQTRIDFSTGNLKVIFDWAPFCSGPLSVGEMLTTVMSEEHAAGGDKRRPIIITAFGIHDASYELQVSQNNIKDWYRDQMPQEIFKRDGWRAAGLVACRQATTQFVRAAAAGVGAAGVKAGADSPLSPEDREEQVGNQEEQEEEEEAEKGRGHGGARRTRKRRGRRLLQRREAVAEAVPGDVGRGDATRSNTTEVPVSSSALVSATTSEGSAPPPMVFVLQNNAYNDDGFQQQFLDEVRRIQREEIGIGIPDAELGSSTSAGVDKPNDGGDALGESKAVDINDDGAGVFLVDNSVNLYGKLSCYRIDPSSHYHEPVKLVEAKMLWDLISLVDRVSGPAPATHGSGSDANSSGTTVAAEVLGVGLAAAVLLTVVHTVKLWKLFRNGRYRCSASSSDRGF